MRYHDWYRGVDLHAIDPDSFDECFYVLENTFAYSSFRMASPHRLYMRWLDDHPEHGVAAYKLHKQVLQILQRRENCSRWILKSPHHLRYLNPLTEVYPDACLVQTHRDPVKVIPSFISLIISTRGIFTKYLDLKTLTEESIQAANRKLSDQGISFDVVQADHSYDFDIHQKPEGMSDEELYTLIWDSLRADYPGPWEFSIGE